MSNLRPFQRKVERYLIAYMQRGRSKAGGRSNLKQAHPARTIRRARYVWPPTAGEDRAKLLTPEQKRIREEERQLRPMLARHLRQRGVVV